MWFHYLPNLLIAALGYILFSICIIFFYNYHEVTSRIIQARSIFLTGMVIFLLFKLKHDLEVHLMNAYAKNSSDRAFIGAIGKLLTILLLVLTCLSALSILGVPLQALLTIGGVSGLAVSWASKEFIANFFGGLMIFISRPFTIGDRIVVMGKNIEGDVEKIGWHSTVVRNVDKRPIFIPNALLTGAVIENVSRMSHRRFETTLDLEYADFGKISMIVEQIEVFLKNHKKIDSKEMIRVHFGMFGDYALKIQIRAFTYVVSSSEFVKIEQELLLGLGDLINQAGAHMAYPTSSIILRQESDSDKE